MNVNSPASLSVPERTPVVPSRVRPPGSLPAFTLQDSPETLALSVWLYAPPAVPSGRVDVVISRGAIVSVRLLTELAVPYCAVTVNGKLPETVGVPEIFPDESRTKPAGRLPVSVQVAPAGFEASSAL